MKKTLLGVAVTLFVALLTVVNDVAPAPKELQIKIQL
jgi:uncharacterized protein YhhL (DUF1145 family)